MSASKRPAPRAKNPSTGPTASGTGPSLVDALGPIAERAQAEVQRQLKGLFGGFVRSYLPQTWVFETPEETAALVVDGDGHARAVAGAPAGRDVTVRWSRSLVLEALSGEGAARALAGPRPLVTFQSRKGEAAFSFLRQRFGF